MTDTRQKQVVWLGPEQMDQWDQFVRGHPNHSVYYLSGWQKAIEQSFNHIKGHVLVLVDSGSGKLRAGLPIYVVSSWLLGKRLVSVPFAAACDPLVDSGADAGLLHSELLRFQRAQGGSRVEIRALDAAPLLLGHGSVVSRPHKHHYLPLNRPLGELKSCFSRTAIRRMIRKAEQGGVRVRSGEDLDDLKLFHVMLTQSRRRLGLPGIPWAFFQALWGCLSPANLCLLIAQHHDRPVGAVLSSKEGERFTMEHIGVDLSSQAAGVTQLLYWEAIKKAFACGCNRFSFGRTSIDNHGLLAFKSHWRPEEADVSVFSYPGDAQEPEKGKLRTRLVRGFLRNAPHLLYELGGRFCYKHLG